MGPGQFRPRPSGGQLRSTSTAVGCLDYRHTFGSQLAMKGESLYKISTLMGNSPEICRRHYAALIPETLSGSVEFPTALQLEHKCPTMTM